MDDPDLAVLVDHLVAEERWLDALVADLPEDRWDTPTPAAGWSVRDQISHLADGEELAATALAEPAAFADRLVAMLGDLDATLSAAGRRARQPGERLVGRWRSERERTVGHLRALDPETRVPWIAGLMSPRSFATARLMETWAHGCDVAAGVGAPCSVSPRLRHVAHLGVATRAFTFRNRGLEVPGADVCIELRAPDGEHWRWGSVGASDHVRGDALEFCLVVTQRRHVAETALVVEGPGATAWMSIAQAFAGPPTEASRTS